VLKVTSPKVTGEVIQSPEHMAVFDSPMHDSDMIYVLRPSPNYVAEDSSIPAKNFLLSAHFSLLQPGHLRPICFEHAMPLSRCALAISAKACMKIGLPFSDSDLLIVSACPLSPMTS